MPFPRTGLRKKHPSSSHLPIRETCTPVPSFLQLPPHCSTQEQHSGHPTAARGCTDAAPAQHSLVVAMQTAAGSTEPAALQSVLQCAAQPPACSQPAVELTEPLAALCTAQCTAVLLLHRWGTAVRLQTQPSMQCCS